MADGSTLSVSGTLTGPKMVQKLTGINGYDLEIPLSVHMAFFSYVDRPGIIGAVGKILGDANVNIAGMQVSRDDETAKALVALILEKTIPMTSWRRSRPRSAPRPCGSSTWSDTADAATAAAARPAQRSGSTGGHRPAGMSRPLVSARPAAHHPPPGGSGESPAPRMPDGGLPAPSESVDTGARVAHVSSVERPDGERDLTGTRTSTYRRSMQRLEVLILIPSRGEVR